MSRDRELTEIEKSWLVSIDTLLLQMSVPAHAVVAARMVDLWGAGGKEFQRRLVERAMAWRRRHCELMTVAADQLGPCGRLLDLLGQPPKPTPSPAAKRPPRRARGPVVRPSRRPNGPGWRIDEEEAKRFMKLIEEEGISSVFDPGVSITGRDELFHPPLIVLDGVGVFHKQIWPAYERGAIERPWDPVEREPAIALAIDLALLVIRRERKWTWLICDRHFKRLPWRHPCKVEPERRPGWKLVTGAMEEAGLIEQKRAQTWRLTDEGVSVAGCLSDTWRSIARP